MQVGFVFWMRVPTRRHKLRSRCSNRFSTNDKSKLANSSRAASRTAGNGLSKALNQETNRIRHALRT